MKPFSDGTFYWMVILLIASFAFVWLIVESRNLLRFLRRPPEERDGDELFAMIIGLLLALFGGFGLLKHFMGW